ncbi:hypothetical protein FACS1894216_18430 [Synergistales bacterium]|nr:hypothetical protein FACS1894216_18430 [Synergistales bacterium]
MGNLLKPKNDLIFKRIFGADENIDILTGFLKSILRLPAAEYSEVALCDPNLRYDREDDKIGILDLKVKTTSGKIIDVEIQLRIVPQFRERIMFYTSKMFAEQINYGEEYEVIKQVIQILIVDGQFFAENNGYHHRFTLYDPNSQLEFTDFLEVHTLELPKLPENADGSNLWNWLKLLNSEKEEDFNMLAQTSPQMDKAVTIVKRLSADEQFRYECEQAEKRRRDYMVIMNTAIREGEARGRAEGALQEKLLIAKSLLAINLPLDQIAKTTGLTSSQIEAL